MAVINYLPTKKSASPIQGKKIIWEYLDTSTGDWLESETERDDYYPPNVTNIPAITRKIPQNGLIFQGLEITQESLISNYSDNKVVKIGAMYGTNDGSTLALLRVTERTTLINNITINKTTSNPVPIIIYDIHFNLIREYSLMGTGNRTQEISFPNIGDYWVKVQGNEYSPGRTASQSGSFVGLNSNQKGALLRVFCGNVKSINAYCFDRNTSLEMAIIPSSVTNIYRNAFSVCQRLKNITIPSSVTTIDFLVFFSCQGLKNITIPSSVTTISGIEAFRYCSSLTNVSIPNSIPEISSYTFSNCSSLTNVTIPNSITSLADNAFTGCESIKRYDFTKYISIPTISSSTFAGIPASTLIVVPDNLVDAWKIATNWTAYADIILSKSTYIGRYEDDL